MRTFTHDGITYRLDHDQESVYEARRAWFNKFGLDAADRVALVLTLEQYFSEFSRSDDDQAIICQLNCDLHAALNS
jgi:hypothetical protein